MTDAEKILKSYRSAMEDIASRTGDTISGGAKNSLSSDVNSAASAYDLTQGIRDTVLNDYLSDYAHGLNRAKSDLAQLESSGADVRDIRSQQNIVDDWQRKYDAAIAVGNAQRQAAQAAYGLADDIRSSAATDIARAKDGLGYAGQTAVDVGAALTEIGLDRAKSSLLLKGLPSHYKDDELLKKLADTLKLAPLAARKYGENTQKARLDGASAGEASFYGALSAITDAAIEDSLDGLAGAYGVGRWDAEIKGAFRRYAKTETGKQLLGVAASATGEGFESFVNSVVRQTLKSVYNGKDAIQNISEANWDKAIHDAVVDSILSLPHATKSESFKAR